MIFSHITNFCLQYVPALHAGRIEWRTGSDPRQLRASVLQLLELVREQHVRHVLLDMNTVPDLSLADQLWLGTQVVPRLAALPLERLVLAIDTSRVHNQLAIDSLLKLALTVIRFEPHYFPDADSAFDWLLDGAPARPALAAEWASRYK